MPTSAFGTDSKVTLEELILQSVSRQVSLVAIGRKTEIIGAGKVIAGDDEWRDYFEALAIKASCILSVPSLHASTLWELDWLASRHLFARVVIILTGLHFGVEQDQYKLSDLTTRLRVAGWRLPINLTPSSLISFQSSGAVAQHTPNSKHKVRPLRALIQRVAAVDLTPID